MQAPVAASAPASAARPALLPQIAAPVVALTQAADGDHEMTLTISPERLGPVTVRAHISGGSIRIELQAPNDLGRDALRTILTGLRRDLAIAAPHATLALSGQDAGSGQSATSQSHGQAGTHSPSAHGTAAQGQSSQGPSSQGQAAQQGNGSQQSGAQTGPSRTEREPAGTGDPLDHPASIQTPHGGIDVYA